MRTGTIKGMAFLIAAITGFNAGAAEISNVTVRQRWPWSRLVDIDYVITDATQAVDIAVAAFNGEQPLMLEGGLSGDLNGVTGQGTRRIIWDPTQSQYTNEEVLAKFRVTLTSTLTPVYMIVDLTKAAGAEGQITYVSEVDLASGVYGTVETNPVAGVNSIVWTGVTNDSVYATDKLVLRHISADTFTMGSPGSETGREGDNREDLHQVRLTKGYYAGVFEVTQRQWERIQGNKHACYFNNTSYYATRPVEKVSYHTIRGASNETVTVNWPATKNDVGATSFLRQLRSKTGISGFDLPTDAQWECACRAGTTGALNDGTLNLTNTFADLKLDLMARYQYNGGKYWNGSSWDNYLQNSTTAQGTAAVGSYHPNAWGLYDMHGNVAEWCLDWYVIRLGTTMVVDPLGAASGMKRVIRGGGIDYKAADQRSAGRNSRAPSENYYAYLGFRLVINMP
ncbi:MAG: formylglycine-generating enzyme family protein [Kiritimatiellia bacterium]